MRANGMIVFIAAVLVAGIATSCSSSGQSAVTTAGPVSSKVAVINDPSSATTAESTLVAHGAPPLPTQGAFTTGKYRNLFMEWKPEIGPEIQAKVDATWKQFFESTDEDKRLYYPAGKNENGPMAYVPDVNDRDVRTEGMSYGMMLAVQMNKKDVFDAIWNWAKTKMYQVSGPYQGYFAWHCTFDGEKIDENPAPDGEEYFAMSLFFAAGRWGNGKGIYDYQTEANNVLNAMLHKEDISGGIISGATNMFGPANQVVFVPSTGGDLNGFTDPSYHVAGFYELWSQWASGYKDETADRARWAEIARTSREVLFPKAANERGLSPDYAEFSGKPKNLTEYDGKNMYAYDAWRVAMNWGVDFSWHAKAPIETELADRLQKFMVSEGTTSFHNTYNMDGTAGDTYHDSGHAAMLATAGLAASNPRAYDFVEGLWAAPIPTGQYRYYSGLLYFFGLLAVSGNYRIYAPAHT